MMANKDDCIGNVSSNLRLLLMGTLRYLGQGLTFDYVEEFSFVSGEVHRKLQEMNTISY
jgi:hypothetical protein